MLEQHIWSRSHHPGHIPSMDFSFLYFNCFFVIHYSYSDTVKLFPNQPNTYHWIFFAIMDTTKSQGPYIVHMKDAWSRLRYIFTPILFHLSPVHSSAFLLATHMTSSKKPPYMYAADIGDVPFYAPVMVTPCILNLILILSFHQRSLRWKMVNSSCG